MLEGAADHLDDAAVVVDAADPADEVGLVLGLDQDRGVGGEVDGLVGRNRELDLGHLRLLAVADGRQSVIEVPVTVTRDRPSLTLLRVPGVRRPFRSARTSGDLGMQRLPCNARPAILLCPI